MRTFKHFLLKNSYLLLAALGFVFLSFIIDHYWSANASINIINKKIATYVNKQEDDFDKLVHNAIDVNRIASKQYDEPFLKSLTGIQYFFFIYTKENSGINSLAFWNTQTILPSESILLDSNAQGFSQLSNGYYVWKKKFVNSYTCIALIPVKWNYSITNDYLQNTFASNYSLDDDYDVVNEKLSTQIKSNNGAFLFSITKKKENIIPANNPFEIIFRLLAILMVLIFIHLLAYHFAQKNFYIGTGFLIAVIILLRSATYFFSIPFNFRQFELFSPAIYGCNAIMCSLGDLLINALLFLWIVLFIRYYLQERKYKPRFKSSFLKWVGIMVGTVLLFVCTLLAGYVVSSLVFDSQISFDVVNFFTLNIYSLLGFLVLGCVAISYFFLTQIFLYLLQPMLSKSRMKQVVLLVVTGLAIFTTRLGDTSIVFELCLLSWLIVYVLLLSSNYLTLLAERVSSSRFVFWLFFFSVSITVIIMIENRKKEIENRKHYAETLSVQADPSSERLIGTVLTDFSNEVLAPVFDKFKQESSNKELKDSLLNIDFTGYLNKFDTHIYTFDETQHPLYNDDTTSFNTLSTTLKEEGKPTAVNDLYYYPISYNRYSYTYEKEITDSSGKLLGSVFLKATPKAYKTDALYPELLLKDYSNSIENSPVYSYAVYNNLQLVNNHNDYPFPYQLDSTQIPSADFATITKNGFNELWYNAGPDKVVVIVRKDNLFIESITLFSYLFCACLFINAIFWLLNTIVRSGLRFDELRSYWQVTIRNQVHGTIIFISVVLFIVVGAATVLFFIDRYNSANREKLELIIQVMENDISNSLNTVPLSNDLSKIYAKNNKEKLEQTINRISEMHAVDINLYDVNGNLQVSSLSLPYSKGIVSYKMDPLAFYHMHQLKEIQYFQNEMIGSLQYISHYVPVIDSYGREVAYLNIPYFASQTKLREEISNFLVAIINLNAFIFLIAGIVAFLITNRITRSFSFLRDKMREIYLGEINEAIVWKRNDEIGELVKEYNKMVSKLDERAATLAKNEREGAWREMARQVAHEIKNPLTPMKLSLQYLQKAIANNSDNVKELSESVSKTLVEQIDNLSKIASDFSQFANIGNPKKERFDLNELLALLVHLYVGEENHRIDWNPLPQPVLINADKTHINRLFTNLILNALQAVPDNNAPHIVIDEELLQEKVLIKIKDNGTGIEEKLRSNIFTPNFTTKTSGTGLGLAMCKGIVEQNRGSIWFQTRKGKGTTFFIELPLAVD